MKPLVYIAGPYTGGDPILNTRQAVQWGERIEEYGCDVVIPHLSMLWHLISPAPVERWYQRDLAVLARCDALVRFPGDSTGADNEVAFAKDHGISYFKTSGSMFHQSFNDWLTHRGETA